jgi:hypothetical protein
MIPGELKQPVIGKENAKNEFVEAMKEVSKTWPRVESGES